MVNGSIVTNNGLKIIMNRAFKSVPDYTTLDKFKVGYDNGTPNVADNELDYLIPLTGTEAVDSCDATTGWTDSADMTVSVNASTYKEGTGALNLTKDGGASDTASTDKTTTSRDFTSKELMVWLYIKDATMYAKLATTDCVTIRFGSDNANYYYYTRDKSNLEVGWNVVRFSTATADGTTGAPVIAACDYSYIAIKATGAAITWSAADLIMDDWKVASADDFLGSITLGYPTIDETNHECELRALVPTTQANGYLVNSIGWYNTDVSRLMGTEATFAEESKSDTDEFIIITKIRMV
jgi:hypothetical protein